MMLCVELMIKRCNRCSITRWRKIYIKKGENCYVYTLKREKFSIFLSFFNFNQLKMRFASNLFHEYWKFTWWRCFSFKSSLFYQYKKVYKYIFLMQMKISNLCYENEEKNNKLCYREVKNCWFYSSTKI